MRRVDPDVVEGHLGELVDAVGLAQRMNGHAVDESVHENAWAVALGAVPVRASTTHCCAYEAQLVQILRPVMR